MANKPNPIDWDAVKNMMKSGLGAPTIAAQLHISDQTLYDRCKKDNGVEFLELKQKMMDMGTEMLVAKGYQMAINGDRTMLIFYLKNRAGFADHLKIDGEVPGELINSYKQAINASSQAHARLNQKIKK